MYKLNDVFYLDKEYAQRAEFCNKNNLAIIEIEADEHGRRFKIAEMPQPSPKEEAQQNLNELKQWFDVEYARLEQKYRRLHTLNKFCDDGTRPFDQLILLYEEAERKRKQIQDLEAFIDNE